MTQPFIRVLGSCDWHATAGNDQSHYTLCDKILIDTGSAAMMNLLNNGIEPTDIPLIFFTHMHSDHFMGLAPILHNWRVVKGDLGGLTIVGPKARVRKAVSLSLGLIFHDSPDMMGQIKTLPNIVELEGYDCTYETEDFLVHATDSQHSVPGLCYTFTDKKTGHKIGFSGDTGYQEKYGAFFRDCDLLVHECSFGGATLEEEKKIKSRHSSAEEAVRVSLESGAKKLLLTHTYEPKREAALATARAGLSIPVEWAMPGKVFEF